MTNELQIKRRVREINNHVQAGKPCYWDQTPDKRFRIFRARLSKDRFQVMPIAGQKWLNANLTDNFEFYR